MFASRVLRANSAKQALRNIVAQLPKERQLAYERLVESVPVSPIHRLSDAATANCPNNVYLKLEYANDVGCHHRRLYPFVLALYEAEGKIVPGVTPVVEASNGGAAVAFAHCATALGFNQPRPPLTVVPFNVTAGRRKMLQDIGARIHLAPMGDRDVTVVELRRVLAADREARKCDEKPRLYCTTKIKRGAEVGYGRVIDEVLDQGVAPDLMLATVGSGASMSGMGRRLKATCPHARIVVVEHEATPVNSTLARTGKVITFERPPHNYQGSGHWGVDKSLLNISFDLIDDFVSFSTEEAEEARLRVLEEDGISVGLTTSGCIAALSHLPAEFRGKNILITAYDTYDRSRHESLDENEAVVA